MSILSDAAPATTPTPATSCAAKNLSPDQRQQRALAALAGTQALRHHVGE